MNVVGSSKKIKDYLSLDLFDPLQVFVGLNRKNKIWKNKHSRCSFLAKLQFSDLIKAYGNLASEANDLLPQGALGYSSTEKYFSSIEKEYVKESIPKLNSFCLAYLTVSIPEMYKNYYTNVFKKIYPDIILNPISDTTQFGRRFSDQGCDAILFSLKSNYLDGYEYIDIFANNDANFSGIKNKKLSNKIKNSQNISDSYRRSKEYREIITEIENLCVIRPILTIPMRKIYVRKSLNTAGIGWGPLNEFYLGNITRVKK